MGAAGSGTTTLGIELARELGYEHFDTDDFLWEDTSPPYQRKRTVEMREEMLCETLQSSPKWILTGSMVGWGDCILPFFNLVIYLWVPQDIRIARLKEREKRKHGIKIDEGQSMHQTHLDFIAWAKEYDSGDESMRSKKYHDIWLDKVSCKVIRIEDLHELKDKVDLVREALSQI